MLFLIAIVGGGVVGVIVNRVIAWGGDRFRLPTTMTSTRRLQRRRRRLWRRMARINRELNVLDMELSQRDDFRPEEIPF